MKHLTDKDIDEIIAMYNCDYPRYSIADIARCCEISESKVRKILLAEGYYYFKMWWNTGTSNLSLPTQLLERVLLVGTFLKVFGFNNYGLIILIGIAYETIKVLFGRFYYNHGLAVREITVGNKYNHQLMGIYHKVEVEKKTFEENKII